MFSRFRQAAALPLCALAVFAGAAAVWALYPSSADASLQSLDDPPDQSHTVGQPAPRPAGAVPPSANARWVGKWSEWNHHSVPWRCEVSPATIDLGFDIHLGINVILDLYALDIGCKGGITDIDIAGRARNQTLPQTRVGSYAYSGCTQNRPPGSSGCGHNINESITPTVLADLGALAPDPQVDEGAQTVAGHSVTLSFRYKKTGSHQTWRYQYCGPNDWESKLVEGWHQVARDDRSDAVPNTQKYYGKPSGLANPPSVRRATRYENPPHSSGIDASDATDPDYGLCWDTESLTVDIGADVTVDEGDPAVLDVTLTRGDTSTSSPCVQVDWGTSNGSAVGGMLSTPGIDFGRVTNSTLTFAAGAMTAGGAESVTAQMPAIQTQADTVIEGDEQFTVGLKPVTVSLCGGTGPTPEVGRDSATVTIRDTPSARQVSISPTAVTVTEGDPGDSTVAQVTVSHDGSAGDVTSVQWRRVDGSALGSTASPPNNDYVALATTWQTLTFPASATTMTADIDIVEDTVCEATETFEVRIGSPLPSATTTVAVGSATVTILDDDCTNPQLSAGPDISVTEGTGGPATVATVGVSHDGNAGDVASVLYHVVAETATLGTDFTGVAPAGARASIPSTATAATVSVDVDPDAVCEPDETFRVVISNPLPAGSATVLVPDARVRIVDDDCTATNIRVDPDTVQVDESDPFARLTITHDGSAGDVVSVRYRLFDATATAGSDYTTVAASGIITTFGAATSVNVDIPILDDTVCESTETFTMVIDSPVLRHGVTATITNPTGRVRIIDDDCTPTVTSGCDEQQPTGTHTEGTPIGAHPRRGPCPVTYSWGTWPGAQTAGRGAPYTSAAWAHGSDEFVCQLRYGTGPNDFCNARVQITVLDTGPETLGTGVVLLYPEDGGFEAANWNPSPRVPADRPDATPAPLAATRPVHRVRLCAQRTRRRCLGHSRIQRQTRRVTFHSG